MDPTPTPAAVDDAYPYKKPGFGHKLVMLLVITLPIALTGFAIVWAWQSHVTWLDLGLLVGMWTVAAMGVTLGYHRMLTHGAFHARGPVRFILLAAACMSLQGGPATWAATHRRHHARADRPGDPHSPAEGMWHAHFGWLPKGRLVTRGPAHRKLMEDPVVAFVERTQGVWMVLGFLIPGLIAWAVTTTLMGGLQGVLWGGAVRVFLAHHTTWSVNSVAHMWGTRPYKAPDAARNNVLVALVSFGEGWHNNHHAFPNSAWIGHRWYQLDPGREIIRLMARLRLVSHVVVPTKEERQARLRRGGRTPATQMASVAGVSPPKQ